ncbi:MAG TPA: TIGR00725 family protein [Candidatus Anoxymicrobiaceae bacterium]
MASSLEVRMYISVIGAGDRASELEEAAFEVGSLIAKRGHVLVCGGLGGVMDAAARGASVAGGMVIGILPDEDRRRASRWLTVSIPTGMGQARNALVAGSGDAVIAVGGGYGTLSEIGFALKLGKPVIGLKTWELDGRGARPGGMLKASSPRDAVDMAEQHLAL